MSKELGILIVNYNNIDYTRNCINDLLNQINKNFEIFLFDQNSNEEGTISYLNKIDQYENINVIKNDKNVDLNRVWNDFYEMSNNKFICFLNNDVRLTNNFTDDIVNIFNDNNNIGAVIHVTNNPNYIKPSFSLNYEILDPPLYQGWDFCLRREEYNVIPDTLRIFGGDDFLFSNVVKNNNSIALTYSSPIIHYKERTRNNIGDEINKIHRKDTINYNREIKERNLKLLNNTTNTNKCNKYPPKDIKLIQNKNCIFTTIIGDYDDLPKLNINKEDNWDYICFTDNKKLKSDVWKLIYVDSDYDNLLERARLSRFYKLNYYKFLSSYENLIYVDARIKIKSQLNNYLKHLNDHDFVFNKHPNANSIKEEMERVLSGGLERKEVVEEMKKKYNKVNYKYDNDLYVGKILLFKNNKKNIKFFSDWWYMVKNYSYRDQLSLNYALSINKNIKYKVIDYNKTIKNYFPLAKRKSKRLTFK
ncbi:MAG: glycosyltransferase [archaeon]